MPVKEMVREVNHPLIKHKIGLLRSGDISTKDFRELCSEIGGFLTYEATRELETEKQEIIGWQNEPVQVDVIKGKKLTVVPILRAGLGMLDGVIKLIPNAKISVVGLYRDEETSQPVPYFEKLTKGLEERTALVIDPMLATGGTFVAAVDLLKKHGCKKVIGLFLVAAPEGIEKVKAHHDDVEIIVAAIDEKLNEKGYILPGLGDAGDKIFGTK